MPKLNANGAPAPLEIPLQTTLLNALLDNNVPISTSCGGVAACGLCRLTVTAGRELLSPANAKEIEHMGNASIGAGRRLACQARIIEDGEITVDIPPVEDPIARKQRKWTQGYLARKSQTPPRSLPKGGRRGGSGGGRRGR